MIFDSYSRKSNFRPKTSSGKFLGNLSCTLWVLVGLYIFPVIATGKTALLQIKQRVMLQAEQDIHVIARQKRWLEYQLHLEISPPEMARAYPPCPQVLVVAKPDNDRQQFMHMRYRVSCTGTPSWSANVNVKAQVSMKVVVARQNIERGQSLLIGDVELKKNPLGSGRDEYLTDLQDVTGLLAKTRLRAMQPIRRSQLDRPVLVKRNQDVVMIAMNGEIEIKTRGITLEDGKKGDVIRVRNPRSERIINAKVKQQGVVMILIP
jgi:flagella basal body P-ring formation protein FlgA